MSRDRLVHPGRHQERQVRLPRALDDHVLEFKQPEKSLDSPSHINESFLKLILIILQPKSLKKENSYAHLCDVDKAW